jgi:hypothetical protein
MHFLTLAYSSEGSPALAASDIINYTWITLQNSSLYPVVAFTFLLPLCMTLLPSTNYSAEWSGRVWQFSADSNGNFKRTKQPLLSATGCHPGSSNSKNVCQTASIICIGLSHPRLDGLGSIALWEHELSFNFNIKESRFYPKYRTTHVYHTMPLCHKHPLKYIAAENSCLELGTVIYRGWIGRE